MIKKQVSNLKDTYFKYERYIAPIALLSGFVWDSLTLKRIDLLYENMVIVAYLLIAGISIVYVNLYYTKYLRSRFFEKLLYVTPFTLQFAFGGLFSAFVIFYSKSSSFIDSWPFLLILIFLLLGNEIFRNQYVRLVFQMSVFFTALYSYLIIALPIVFNQMGPVIFVLSGLVSLGLIYAFFLLLKRIIQEKYIQTKKPLIISIVLIFLVFNIMYFFGIIPPVPLSLKESGIYNSVQATSQGYEVSYEKNPWYEFYRDYNNDFKWQPGQRVYCYSAIFAPIKFNETVYHKWMYYDKNQDKWVERGKIGYGISGGRDGGYRGYSYKISIQPGKWRVEIVNDRDQVLGRVKFEVHQVEALPELITETY